MQRRPFREERLVSQRDGSPTVSILGSQQASPDQLTDDREDGSCFAEFIPEGPPARRRASGIDVDQRLKDPRQRGIKVYILDLSELIQERLSPAIDRTTQPA